MQLLSAFQLCFPGWVVVSGFDAGVDDDWASTNIPALEHRFGDQPSDVDGFGEIVDGLVKIQAGAAKKHQISDIIAKLFPFSP